MVIDDHNRSIGRSQRRCVEYNKHSRCVEPVAVYTDTMRACSALTCRVNEKQILFKAPGTYLLIRHLFIFNNNSIVGRCRALRTYLWRSGGSHYRFHFWRWVSVKTIFFSSLTFLNLQTAPKLYLLNITTV